MDKFSSVTDLKKTLVCLCVLLLVGWFVGVSFCIYMLVFAIVDWFLLLYKPEKEA